MRKEMTTIQGSRRSSFASILLAFLVLLAPTMLSAAMLGTYAITMGSTAVTASVVVTTAPGIFAANMDGQGVFAGQVVEVNPDGSQTVLNPAVWNASTNQYDANPFSLGPAGEQVYLVLYATGIRDAGTVAASVNGVSLPVAYDGAQAQFCGLDQINLEVPQTLAGAGLVTLIVTVDGTPANTVTFQIE